MLALACVLGLLTAELPGPAGLPSPGAPSEPGAALLDPADASAALADALAVEVGEMPARDWVLRAEWRAGVLAFSVWREGVALLERQVEARGDRAAALRTAALILAEALPVLTARTSNVAPARSATLAATLADSPPPTNTATQAGSGEYQRAAGGAVGGSAPAGTATQASSGVYLRAAGGAVGWSAPAALLPVLAATAGLRWGQTELGLGVLVGANGPSAQAGVESQALLAALLGVGRTRLAGGSGAALWLSLAAGPAYERVHGILRAFALPTPFAESGLSLLLLPSVSAEWQAGRLAVEAGAGLVVRAARFSVNLPGPFAADDPPVDAGLVNPWVFLAVSTAVGGE